MYTDASKAHKLQAGSQQQAASNSQQQASLGLTAAAMLPKPGGQKQEHQYMEIWS